MGLNIQVQCLHFLVIFLKSMKFIDKIARIIMNLVAIKPPGKNEEQFLIDKLFLYIQSKIYKHYLPNVRLTLPYYRDDTPGSNVLVNPGAIT